MGNMIGIHYMYGLYGLYGMYGMDEKVEMIKLILEMKWILGLDGYYR